MIDHRHGVRLLVEHELLAVRRGDANLLTGVVVRAGQRVAVDERVVRDHGVVRRGRGGEGHDEGEREQRGTKAHGNDSCRYGERCSKVGYGLSLKGGAYSTR